MKRKILILILFAFILNSCSEIKTTKPKEVFKFWSGTTTLPKDFKLLKGEYWQSSHLTKEYIMYLKFKSSDSWWDEFLKQNEISRNNNNWSIPSNAPDWFKPSENSIKFGGDEDFDQGSRYFKDTITQVCYIYEVQL